MLADGHLPAVSAVASVHGSFLTDALTTAARSPVALCRTSNNPSIESLSRTFA